METLTLSIAGMTCGHCVASVRHALETVPGVQVQHVGIGAAELRVGATAPPASVDAVLAAVREAGYEAAIEPVRTTERRP